MSADVTREERRLILHVGGPKCGSSALQAALSATPELSAKTGSDLDYVGARPSGKRWTLQRGSALQKAAQRLVHGYVSWPNLGRQDDPAPVFAALDRVWRGAKRGAATPVLSNEGWIGQADSFAEHLPHWFDPDKGAPIEVLGFARPPIDWLNSAYWQWGVWSGRSFQGWLENVVLPYRLGSSFARWKALPNTRLRLHLSGDVLKAFSQTYDVTLPPAPSRNTALPPAMVGFLMRNRRFRPTPHDSATEFIFQRWCTVENAPRLWAIMPRHLPLIQTAVKAEVETLFGLLPQEEGRAIRQANPRWGRPAAYGDQIRGGRSRLDDTEELAQLYMALCRGVRAAAQAAGQRPPQLQPPLATRSAVHAWDVPVSVALDHLIALDTGLRRRRWLSRPFRG